MRNGQRRSKGWILVVLVVPLIFPDYFMNILHMNQGSTTTNTSLPLYESRELEISFIGIDEEIVDIVLLRSAFNTSEAPYPAEYPSGEIMSYLEFNHIRFTFKSQDVLPTLYSQLSSVATHEINSSDYFIRQEAFIDALIESTVIPATQYAWSTYHILVINLATVTSPFGTKNVYLNYTREDHDTQQRSLLRPYAPYGVSFSLPNQTIVGLLVSSDPQIESSNYPLYQSLLNGTMTHQQWNSNLKDQLEHTIWCRFHPSPVFRYYAHREVRIHLALIGMDTTYSILDMKDYLDQILIETKVEELLCISEIQVLTFISNAPLELQTLTFNDWGSYSAWLIQVSRYLKDEGEEFWDIPYSLSEPDYGSPQDLYVAILYGNESFLPYTPENAGITFYASDMTDEGGLALITLNYDQIFSSHEGFTQTTLHEISHLFGLIHSHDYWHPLTQQVESSWDWGYTSSPVTYLCTGYDYDIFDKLVVWRNQMYSLLTAMTEYEYEQRRIQALKTQIEEGSFLSLNGSLHKAVQIYQVYHQQKVFHETFTFGLNIIIGLAILLPTVAAFLILGKGWWNRGRK